MRVRPLLAGGLIAAGLSAFGVAALAGVASAHDLTGASAQATCNADTVTVSWTFTSVNAGDHTIQTVTFNRAVDSSSHTATTVHATTHETPGTSPELRATVIFEDGYQSSYNVGTNISDDICPTPSTTVPTTPRTAPPTTVPPTTVPPTTVPPTTVPPTTVPPTTVPPTTVPTPTTRPLPTSPAPTPTPTVKEQVEVKPVAQVTPTTAAPVTALPTTGSSSNVLLVAGVASVLAGGALLLAGRRPKEA